MSFQGSLDLSALLQSLLTLGRDGIADLLVLYSLTLLTLSLSANGGAVVSLIPSTEGCSIDLDDGGAGKGVCADEFVVGRMEGDDNDTDLAGDALGSPREVTALDSQRSVFGVSASGAYKMDSLGANTSVGWLTALLKSSAWKIVSEIFALLSHGQFFHPSSVYLPLLSVVCALCTSCGPLVAAVS